MLMPLCICLCLVSCTALHSLVLLAADVVLVRYMHVRNALMSQSHRNPMGTSCSSGLSVYYAWAVTLRVHIWLLLPLSCLVVVMT